MSYTVTNVEDGDSFNVSPKWEWTKSDGEVVTGDTVRIAGVDAPEKGEVGYDTATNKLKNLIDGKDVELRNPVNLSYGRIVCDVYLEGENIFDQLS